MSRLYPLGSLFPAYARSRETLCMRKPTMYAYSTSTGSLTDHVRRIASNSDVSVRKLLEHGVLSV